MSTPDQRLYDAWPWMSAEFTKVRLQIDELIKEVQEPGPRTTAKAQGVIECAQVVCAALKTAEQKGLFVALRDSARAIPSPEFADAGRRIATTLVAVLQEEEALLIRAGMEPDAARLLREDLAQLPTLALSSDNVLRNYDKRVAAAIHAICQSFPKSPARLGMNHLVKYAAQLKKKYGLFGALALAGGNVACVAMDPTMGSSAGISKVLAAMLVDSTSGDV